MPNHHTTYEKLCAHCRETALLGSIESLLGWDERTLLPASAGDYRAEQMTYLAGMIHRRETEPKLGEWLAELVESPLAGDPHSDEGTVIRELKREYDKKVRLPQSLVEEITRTSILGQQTWVEARKNDDFRSFEPLLTKMVSLKRDEADALGYRECPYDALLDNYEPAALTSEVAKVLSALRDELVPLVAAIGAGSRRPNLQILERHYPTGAQREFGERIAALFGFDFRRGRLDVTAHPFCSGMGPHDCRITTRYNERHFNEAFFGILHEAGHGLYEQGLPPEHYGLPTGAAISLGIHESQSRMWENFVGRNLSFWQYAYPLAAQTFPEALGDPSAPGLEAFYFAVNDVRPSLIRVEADEVTYNLHILIRFELEQALINDQMNVVDLPAAWNEKYRKYLGISPPSDADGVLQDIHWSAGLFGYFATYALGNLYAAQFFEQADADCHGLPQQFQSGEFSSLREWLAAKIHRQGRRYSAAELVERVTGKPLAHDALIRHLRAKFGPLYGVE
jgi:carboxypeptidase Taq